MPHAAQAERLVPAQRMVVVLQHWRAHLAELQPKAQLKSAKDGHQTCLDVFHLYYKDGFAKSYLTVVRLPFAPASCVTWPLASWPIYQVITDDAHAGLPAWHTVKETTLRSWTISRCEVLMVFLGGR